MTLGELAARMDAWEYGLWQAYAEVYPFDWERQQLATLCAAVVAYLEQQPRTARDFLPGQPSSPTVAEDEADYERAMAQHRRILTEKGLDKWLQQTSASA